VRADGFASSPPAGRAASVFGSVRAARPRVRHAPRSIGVRVSRAASSGSSVSASRTARTAARATGWRSRSAVADAGTQPASHSWTLAPRSGTAPAAPTSVAARRAATVRATSIVRPRPARPLPPVRPRPRPRPRARRSPRAAPSERAAGRALRAFASSTVHQAFRSSASSPAPPPTPAPAMPTARDRRRSALESRGIPAAASSRVSGCARLPAHRTAAATPATRAEVPLSRAGTSPPSP